MHSFSLQGRRILIVEDEYLVAEHLADLLIDAGAVVLGPMGWHDEVMSFIGGDQCDCDSAILDMNLHGQLSYPIADALTASGIGFVLVTGYDSDALEPAYRHIPRCRKPLHAHNLLAALDAVRSSDPARHSPAA